MSKIEEIIDEIEDYIDNCKFQPFSNSKIIVNRDDLDELIADLRSNIPDEIKKYQRIIANRDAILKDAQDKSDEMVRKANEMTSTLVSEHEIMQQAYIEADRVIDDASVKAQNILDNATNDANAVKNAAIQYTDDSLAKIQEILSNSIEDMTVKYDAIIRSLEANLDVTTQNRKSLHDTPTTGNDPRENVQYGEDYEEYEQYDDYEEYYESPYQENEVEENGEDEKDYSQMTIEDAMREGDIDFEPIKSKKEELSPDEGFESFNLNIDDF